jgi:hypothetical protein
MLSEAGIFERNNNLSKCTGIKSIQIFSHDLTNSGEVEVTRKCSGGWMLERSTIWGEQNPLWL